MALLRAPVTLSLHASDPEPALVEGLCSGDPDVVVFSHSADTWPSYWATLFARHGYRPYDLLRDALWWDQRVPWWHRQNMLVYAREWTPPTRTLDLAQPALLMPELRKRLIATVCIPWRPSPSRLAAFERVKQFWAMFGWPMLTADSDTEVFSLAQARNNAVRQAETDVVVISDADTLIDPLNVLRAVAEPVGICWPFTKYRVLAQEYLDTPLAELASVPHVNSWDGVGILGVGGCLVATTKEYWRLGGQPSEFIGWGWEDTAFTAVVSTLSTVRRFTGSVYAFEHNRLSDADSSEKYLGTVADSPGWDRDVERNRELFRPYNAAKGRAWLMREIVKQRADPDKSP
jgi:hypothetical protein